MRTALTRRRCWFGPGETGWAALPSRHGAEPRASLYEEVTARIVSELEAGRFPWVQPWGSAAAGIDLVPADPSDSENAPDYRIIAGSDDEAREIGTVPYKIHTVLTDNPILSDCRKQAVEGGHPVHLPRRATPMVPRQPT